MWILRIRKDSKRYGWSDDQYINTLLRAYSGPKHDEDTYNWISDRFDMDPTVTEAEIALIEEYDYGAEDEFIVSLQSRKQSPSQRCLDYVNEMVDLAELGNSWQKNPGDRLTERRVAKTIFNGFANRGSMPLLRAEFPTDAEISLQKVRELARKADRAEKQGVQLSGGHHWEEAPSSVTRVRKSTPSSRRLVEEEYSDLGETEDEGYSELDQREEEAVLEADEDEMLEYGRRRHYKISRVRVRKVNGGTKLVDLKELARTERKKLQEHLSPGNKLDRLSMDRKDAGSVLCPFFSTSSRSCRFSPEDCAYLHQERSTDRCTTFDREGYCPKGAFCKYTHSSYVYYVRPRGRDHAIILFDKRTPSSPYYAVR